MEATKPILTKVLPILLLVLAQVANSQDNSAGINIDNPNPNAVLHLVSPGDNQGLLIPTMTTAQRTAMTLGAADDGLMVYDTSVKAFFLWADGTGWLQVANTNQTTLANILAANNDAGNNVISNVDNPVNPNDVANKDYVDNSPTISDGTLIGDGTALSQLGVNTGTNPNQIVQLDGSGALPALDGSALTGITATIAANSITNTELAGDAVQTGNILDGTITDADISDVSVTKITGLGTAATQNTGTGVGDVLQFAVAGTLPVLDGSNLTGVTAAIAANSINSGGIADGTITNADISPTANIDWTKINKTGAALTDFTNDAGFLSAETDPVWVGDRTTLGSVGTINNAGNLVDWSQLKGVPTDFSDGVDNGITSLNLDPATTTGDGVATPLGVNVGTGAGQILQFGTANTLPALDGGALTNVTSTNFSGTLTGDVTGIQGATVVSNVNLTSIAAGTATGGEILSYNGANWVPAIESTATLSDGVSITGTGTTGNELAILSVDPNLIAAGTATGGEILGYNGANWVPVIESTATLSDGVSITGNGTTGNELAILSVDPNLIAAGTAAGGEILGYNGANWVPVIESTATLSDGVSITGNGTTGNELAILSVDPNLIAAGTAAGGEILGYNGANWVPVIESTATLSDGVSITGNGTTGNELAVLSVDPNLIAAGTATGGERLEFNGANWVPVVPTTLNSGNGVTINANNLDLGGVLTGNATITTGAAASDLQIFGAGTLDVDAQADFSAQAVFSNIDVTGGSIFGAALSQADNTLTLTDNGDGTKMAQFELSTISTLTTRTYTLPDADGTLVLDSDLTALTNLISNPGTENLLAGFGAGTSIGGGGSRNVIVGSNAGSGVSTGNDNILIGRNASIGLISGSNNSVIGSGAISGAGTQNGTGLGRGITVTGDGSVALGASAQATGVDAIAIGNGAQGTANDAVAIGGGTIANNPNTIILGDGTASTHNVGIHTQNPQSQLQIGDNLGIFHFDDMGTGPGDPVLGEFFADNLHPVGTDIFYTNNAHASFMFLGQGNVAFLSTGPNAGTAGSSAFLDITSLFELDSVGNGEITGALQIGDIQGGVPPQDGMVRFNGSRLQARESNAWVNMTGFDLPFNSGALSNGSSLFTLDNDAAPAATFINSFNNTAVEIGGHLNFIDGNDRDISINPNLSGAGNNLNLAAGSASGGVNSDGGSVTINAGFGFSGGNGGDIFLNPGGGASPGVIVPNGEIIFDEGFPRAIGVAPNSSVGGDPLDLFAGDAATGNGGNLSLSAGAGSGGNGGDVILNAGLASGAPHGNIVLIPGHDGVETDGGIVMGGVTRIAHQDNTIPGILQLENQDGTFAVEITGHPTMGANYAITLPVAQGTGALTNDGLGNLSWAPSGLVLPFSDVSSGSPTPLFQIDNTGSGAAAAFSNSSDATAMEVGGNISFYEGADRDIGVNQNLAGPGNSLNLFAGGSGDGIGGAGGNVTLTAGAGDAGGGGIGGNVDISGGDGNGAADGGIVNIRSGNANGSGNGGNIRLEPGNGTLNGGIDMRGITRFGQTGPLPGAIELEDNGGANAIEIRSPGTLTPYTMTLPNAVSGVVGHTLVDTDGTGTLGWAPAGLTLPFSDNDGVTAAGSSSFQITNSSTGSAARFIANSGPALELSGDVDIFSGAPRRIGVADNPGADGDDFTIAAGNTANVGSNGGDLILRSGDGNGAGLGGNLVLQTGTGAAQGIVNVQTSLQVDAGTIMNHTGATETLNARQSGTGRSALIEVNNTANTTPALEVRSNGAAGSYLARFDRTVGSSGNGVFIDMNSVNNPGLVISNTTQPIQITAGALNGYVLTSDASGIGTWGPQFGTAISTTNFLVSTANTANVAGTANNLLLGTSASISGGNANVLLGTGTNIGVTPSDNNIAIGTGAVAEGGSSIAIGNGAQANVANAVAIGPNVSTGQANTIILGDGAPLYDVGIGTAAPLARLDVNQGTAAADAIRAEHNAATGSGIVVDMNNASTSAAIRVTNSGGGSSITTDSGIGIGTNTPRGSLDVNGAQYVSITTLSGPQAATAIGAGEYLILLDPTANGNIVLPQAIATEIGRKLIITTSSTSNVNVDAFGGDNIIIGNDAVATTFTMNNAGGTNIFTVTLVQVAVNLWAATSYDRNN